MADDYAANVTTTGSVPIGGQITGNLETSGDIDWFKVTLQAGVTYLFDLRGYDGGGGTLGSGAYEAYLRLYDTQGGYLRSSINGGTGDDPLMSFVPPIAGTYYLGIEDLYDLGTGTYTLRASISPFADDYGNSFSTAGAIAVGVQVAGNIEVPADIDWFKVDLVAGTTYYFEVLGADGGGGTLGAQSLSEAYLRLYDTRGLYIKASADSGLGGDPWMSFTPAISGAYYLSVNELFDTYGGTYKLKASSPDAIPPTITSYSPADGANNVSVAADIKLTFSEAIQRGTGNVVLRLADGTAIETFSAANSSGLTIAGSTLTVNPAADLIPGRHYYLDVAAGAVTDLAGNNFAGLASYDFTAASAVVAPFTVAGTLGNDCFLPSDGDRYFGASGSDTYVISARTLSTAVTASITDTEGSNVIQLVDGTTIASSQFYADAAQLVLSSGAGVQVLGASKFMYQVGANLLSGDTAPLLTYAQFASSLGAALPTGTTPTAGTAGFIVPSGFNQAAAPGAASASGTSTVVGTLGNDVLVPAGGNSHLGGAGNDTYIVSPNVLAPLVTASITDTEGTNTIQIVDGTVIASSSFLNDALQLVLSSGARVQILGASKFIYQVGANVSSGDAAADLTFSQFGAMLGAFIPAVGGAAVSGTANFTVPVTGSSGFTLVALNGGAVTGRAEAEAFIFEFKMVNGRATKVDGDVVITGFDVAKDKLVFEDVGSGVVMTEAQFRQLPGVAIAEDPFNGSTNILLDPDQGVSGGVTIAGILDGVLNQIVVETLP